MKRLVSAAVLFPAILALQGCAAMFTGPEDEVVFTTPQQDLTLHVGDESYPLPATVKLSKKVKEVTVTHPDYPERTIELERKLQGGFVLMDLLFTPGFGLSGLLIDGATSAWFKHDAVVHVDRCAGLAVVDRVAGLGPVAERAVVTEAVVRRVDHDVVDLVAGVVGAADAVVYVDRCAGLAVVGRVAGLGPVTELAVVAV